MSKHSAERPCDPMCDECCRLLVNKRIDDNVAKPLRDRIAHLESELTRAQAEAKHHLKALTRVANGNRHPHGEMLSSAEMMRIARAALLDLRGKQPLVSIEAEVAAERALIERMKKLEAALRKLINAPVQCVETFADGPNIDERPIDEWCCVHCGEYGPSAVGIEHSNDCSYVEALAALDEKCTDE